MSQPTWKDLRNSHLYNQCQVFDDIKQNQLKFDHKYDQCVKEANSLLEKHVIDPTMREPLLPFTISMDMADGACDGYLADPHANTHQEAFNCINKFSRNADAVMATYIDFVYNKAIPPKGQMEYTYFDWLKEIEKVNFDWLEQLDFLISGLLKSHEPSPNDFWNVQLEADLYALDQAEKNMDMEAYHQIYIKFVDDLYNSSGIAILGELIKRYSDIGDYQHTIGNLPDGAKLIFNLKNGDLPSENQVVEFSNPLINALNETRTTIAQSLNRIKSDLDLRSVLPKLEALHEQLEKLLISLIKEKIEFDEARVNTFKKDKSLMYWIPALLFTLKSPMDRDILNSKRLYGLFLDAISEAQDEGQRMLFEIESEAVLKLPVSADEWKIRYNSFLQTLQEIENNPGKLLTMAGKTETADEKVSRYYSVFGRLWSKRLMAEAGRSNDLGPVEITILDHKLREVLKKRTGKASKEEAIIYLESTYMLIKSWTAESGTLKALLFTEDEGFDAVRSRISDLRDLTHLAKDLAKPYLGHVDDQPVLQEARDAYADVLWALEVDGHINGGLPYDGLLPLAKTTYTGLPPNKTELLDYKDTHSFEENMQKLKKKYPWLVDESGYVTFENVDEQRADRAESDTKAAFYKSNDTGREIGLPVGGAIIGSIGGPIGSAIGGLIGKGLNRHINLSDEDAEMAVLQAKLTGIPLISKENASQARTMEGIDWVLSGVGGGLMSKFSRSFLSFGWHAGKASLGFIFRGGLWAVTRSAAGGVSSTFRFVITGGVQGSFRTAGSAIATYFRAPGVPIVRDLARGLTAAYYGTGRGILAFGRGYKNSYITGREAILAAEKNWTIRTIVGNILKHTWDTYGIGLRWGGAVALTSADLADDGEINTWYGCFGLGLFINEIYGWWVWGWNPNGGMVSFFGRYGIELGMQAAQGIDITEPRADYIAFGLLVSYTIRGFNKIATVGESAVAQSRAMALLGKFAKRHKVKVPQSVSGRGQKVVTKSGETVQYSTKNNMVRADATGVNNPIEPVTARMKDGHVLGSRVHSTTSNGKFFNVEVYRKATSNGLPTVASETVKIPRAGRLRNWFSNTMNDRVADRWSYKAFDGVFRAIGWTKNNLGKQRPSWDITQWFKDGWRNVGAKSTKPGTPVFNLRGSIANMEVLPVAYAIGYAGGYFQRADMIMMGGSRVADYGISFFFQHKVQHLYKIDGVMSSVIGYSIGLFINIFGIADIFPTKINETPRLKNYFGYEDNKYTKKAEYYTGLLSRDFAEADDALLKSVRSVSIARLIPPLNAVNPFGSVEGSKNRIEEVGALSYWDRMLSTAAKGEKQLEGVDLNPEKNPQSQLYKTMGREQYRDAVITFNFIDKVLQKSIDNVWYAKDNDGEIDPAKVRLHFLELAMLKRIANNSEMPKIARYASEVADVLKPLMDKVPYLKTKEDVRNFATGLNSDELRGIKEVYQKLIESPFVMYTL